MKSPNNMMLQLTVSDEKAGQKCVRHYQRKKSQFLARRSWNVIKLGKLNAPD